MLQLFKLNLSNDSLGESNSGSLAQQTKQHLDPIPEYNTFILRTVLLTLAGYSIGAFLNVYGKSYLPGLSDQPVKICQDVIPDDTVSTFYSLFLIFFKSPEHLPGALSLALPLYVNASTIKKMRPRVTNQSPVLSKNGITQCSTSYCVAVLVVLILVCKKPKGVDSGSTCQAEYQPLYYSLCEGLVPLLVFAIYPPLLMANLVIFFDFNVLKKQFVKDQLFYKREIEWKCSTKAAKDLLDPNETFFEAFKRLKLILNDALGELVGEKDPEGKIKQIKTERGDHLMLENYYAYFKQQCDETPEAKELDIYNRCYKGNEY